MPDTGVNGSGSFMRRTAGCGGQHADLSGDGLLLVCEMVWGIERPKG